jgi:hypothetical protein
MIEQAPAIGVARNRPWHWVVAGGVLTSALALYGVHWLDVNTKDFHVMSWYANYVVPIGALLVGLAAGSGYGIVSFLSGVKISHRLLWIVVALLIAAYFGAQYVEFRSLNLAYEDGRPVGFWEFLDVQARFFAWKQKDGMTGQPLGAWGYVFKLLEVAGFVLGGLILPFVMRSLPYCDNCLVYMRSKSVAWLPAGVKPRRIKKKDLQAQADLSREREEAWQRGQTALQELAGFASAGRSSELMRSIETHAVAPKEAGKLERRIRLALVYCPSCRNGRLAAMLFAGQGNAIQRTPLGRWDLSPGIVDEICQGT